MTRLPRRRRPRAWLPAVAASVVLVAAAGLGVAVLQGPRTSDDSTASTAGGGGPEAGSAGPEDLGGLAALGTASGIDYADEREREAVVPALLAGEVRRQQFVPPAPSGSASVPDGAAADGADAALARLREPAALQECLRALQPDEGPSDARPLALDYATWAGAPALAVVLPDADPARLVLVVVGPGCSAPDPDTRLRLRVDRP